MTPRLAATRAVERRYIMKEVLRKLSSRKLWAAVVGMATGLAMMEVSSPSGFRIFRESRREESEGRLILS